MPTDDEKKDFKDIYNLDEKSSVNPFEVVDEQKEESSFLSEVKNIFSDDKKNISSYEFKKNKKDAPLITIIGAGAIGGTIACILAESGCRVNCITSPLGTKRLSSSGLVLESPRYKELSFFPQTIPYIKEKPKAIIIATKSSQLDVAMTAVSIKRITNVPIINFCSGYKEFEKLRETYGNSLSQGKADFYTFRNEINTVEHIGGKLRLKFANKFFSEREKLEDVAVVFRRAGIDVDTSEHEVDCVWEWLIPYASASIFCASKDMKLDAIFKQESAKEELYKLVEEMVKVARSDGYKGTIDNNFSMIGKIPENFSLPFVVDYKRGIIKEIKPFALDIIRLAYKNRVPVGFLKKHALNIIRTVEKRQYPEGSEVDFEEIVPDLQEIEDDMYILELSDEEFAIVMNEEIATGQEEIFLNDEEIEDYDYQDTENDNHLLEEEEEEKKDEEDNSKKAWNFYNQIS